MRVVVWMLTGLVAGWTARIVMRRRSHGVLVDLSLGLVGALVGGMIMRRLGVVVPGPGFGEMVVGTVGAIIVIGAARLLAHLVERAGFPAGSARMRAAVHDFEAQIGRMGDVERLVFSKLLRREPVSRDVVASFEEQRSFGDTVADRLTAFGGSWTFIFLFLSGIMVWMMVNAEAERPWDPFPFILLNLVLSCLAALQAPVILMSQNRQAERDRHAAQQDYQVNLKAELEILALHTKLDELRERHWRELVAQQDEQLRLLRSLADARAGNRG